MSWISRTAVRAFLAAAVGVVVLALPGAAQAAGEEYVKYYTVTAGADGAPESLTGIATRFLGSGTRSAEIFDRNAGRRQPDGKVLTDPGRLRAGWLLVLPWDAVGAGVQYGTLPDRPLPAKPAPSKATPKAPAPAPASSPPAFGNATPATGTRPSPNASQLVPPVSTGCASAAASSTRSDWARLRLSADKAWPQSKGKGQVVAVVDSGVNGAMPQLTGHVAGGSDVVQTGQRGDTDCLGTGTAMAALIVAQPVNGEGPAGAAPDASVLPVRIAVNQPAATPQVQVKAIETAVSSGATVIALGTYVDPGDAKVAAAIAAAVGRNVVVVLGAPTPAKPVDPQAKIGEGALWVAGVGVDDKWAVDYRKGAVDITAPGVNVSSLGGTAPTGAGPAGTAQTSGTVTGSGTHYAVAYTAAEAALVRAAYPDLTAAQVTHRIKATADRMGDGPAPNAQYGWGFLNPAEAVTKVLAEEAEAPPPSAAPAPAATAEAAAPPPADEPAGSRSSGGRTALLIVTALVMIAAAAFLGYRIWRLLSRSPGDADDPGRPPEPEIDLYDPRFRTPVPLLVSAGTGPGQVPPPPPPPPGEPVPAGRGPVDDGGLNHWSQVGGHWSDGPDAPAPGARP